VSNIKAFMELSVKTMIALEIQGLCIVSIFEY